MTKEEAITFLKCDRERTCYDFKIGHCDGCNVRTALDMAIVALKAEPKHGRWEYRYLENEEPFFRRRWYCSCCGHWTTYGRPRYCMYCGAKMEEAETDELD